MVELSRRRFLEMLGIGAAAAAIPAIIPEVVAETAPVVAPEIAATVARGPVTHTVSAFLKGACRDKLEAAGWTVSADAGNDWVRVHRGLDDGEAQAMIEAGGITSLNGQNGLYVGSPSPHEYVQPFGVQLEIVAPQPSPYIETARTNLVNPSGYDWRAEQRNAHKRRRA